MKKVIFIILEILGALITLISGIYIGFMVYTMYCVSNNDSIGIIGGADGPTAIFLVGRIGIFPILAIICFVIGLATAIVSGVMIKKKNNSSE